MYVFRVLPFGPFISEYADICWYILGNNVEIKGHTVSVWINFILTSNENPLFFRFISLVSRFSYISKLICQNSGFSSDTCVELVYAYNVHLLKLNSITKRHNDKYDLMTV